MFQRHFWKLLILCDNSVLLCFYFVRCFHQISTLKFSKTLLLVFVFSHTVPNFQHNSFGRYVCQIRRQEFINHLADRFKGTYSQDFLHNFLIIQIYLGHWQDHFRNRFCLRKDLFANKIINQFCETFSADSTHCKKNLGKI